MVRRVLERVAENLPPGILLQSLQFESHLIVFLLRLHGDTLPGFWIFSVVWVDIPLLSFTSRVQFTARSELPAGLLGVIVKYDLSSKSINSYKRV